MDEYIERKAVLKIIADNCPHDKGGYNTEEEMGAGAACYYIRKDVDNIPAADVVSKSEVADLQDALKCEKETNKHLNDEYIALIKENEKLTINMNAYGLAAKTLKEEKDALAMEIFEGIAEIFNKRIAFYTDMAKQSKFTEKHYAETMIKNCEIYLQEIAELKKKYTEGGAE